MTLDPVRLADTADEIAADITAGRRYRARDEIDDLATGYAVQDQVVERLIATGSRSAVAGYKVALNAQALMAHFGVAEPVSARIFRDQVEESPARLQARAYRHFAFEPEIAAIIQRAPEGRLDRDGAAAIVGRLIPAFELIDLRGLDPATGDLPDIVAQNVSNAGAVLGGPGLPPADFDPAAARSRMFRNGETTLDATGAAPQDPLEVVAWMANHLAERGLDLPAGMIVLCGTHAPIASAGVGDVLAFEVEGLGRVEARLSA